MESKRTSLSLKSAYPFGEQKGLKPAIDEIRGIEVEWDLSYNSTIRRGYIVELFRDRGLFDEFIAQYWLEGATESGQNHAAFCVSIKDRYEALLQGDESAADTRLRNADGSVADVTSDEITFSLERDLQAALRSNIGQLEKGLSIIDSGTEMATEAGKIDITAKDASGMTVVIELKAGTAEPAIVAQVLSYMATVGEPSESVRGILVAGDFHARVVLAAKAIPNLELRQYGFQFTFSSVE